MKSFRYRSASLLAVSLVLVGAAWWGCGGGGEQATPTGGETGTATPSGGETGTATPQVATSAATEPSLEVGKQVYMARCAICHGEGGKGDGPAGKVLNPPPRDHTNKAYMSTLTDDQILETIRNGKSAMPPHKELLTQVELESVLLYVRSLAV
jgi:mono/diheme cytochrome c family protein